MKKLDLVCIVEDDPIQLFITKRNIELHAIVKKIIVYKNGKEAYYELKEKFIAGSDLPQIILLDLNMPVWDGWQFLDEFTQLSIERDISIYILSSSNNEMDLERAKKYRQIKNYLVKPVNQEQVKEILTYHIRS